MGAGKWNRVWLPRWHCPNTVLWCQCQACQQAGGLQQVELRDPVFPKWWLRIAFRQWHPAGACFSGKKGCTVPPRHMEEAEAAWSVCVSVFWCQSSVTLLCHSWRQKKQEERGKAEVRLLCVCYWTASNPWLERWKKKWFPSVFSSERDFHNILFIWTLCALRALI